TLSFFNDLPSTLNYTLSLHDALPISSRKFGYSFSCASVSGYSHACETPPSSRYESPWAPLAVGCGSVKTCSPNSIPPLEAPMDRSEEHTSELQSRGHLVCRLLLEKKK